MCTQSGQYGTWITNRQRVIGIYLRGWFCLDCMSSFPTQTLMTFVGGEVLHHLGLLRMMRVLRILKIGKVMRLRRLQVRPSCLPVATHALRKVYRWARSARVCIPESSLRSSWAVGTSATLVFVRTHTSCRCLDQYGRGRVFVGLVVGLETKDCDGNGCITGFNSGVFQL